MRRSCSGAGRASPSSYRARSRSKSSAHSTPGESCPRRPRRETYRGYMGRRSLLFLALVCLAVAGCGKATGKTAATTTATARSTASAKTVWLCFPGRPSDPCAGNLATTVVRADGSTTVEHPTPAASPPIDCFYVYPTVSSEDRGNADLRIQLPELVVAQAQAEQFSRVCRVYAPMYRQITDRGLTTP